MTLKWSSLNSWQRFQAIKREKKTDSGLSFPGIPSLVGKSSNGFFPLLGKREMERNE